MMNDQEISSDKLSSKVNALIIIDIQGKIVRPASRAMVENASALQRMWQRTLSS